MQIRKREIKGVVGYVFNKNKETITKMVSPSPGGFIPHMEDGETVVVCEQDPKVWVYTRNGNENTFLPYYGEKVLKGQPKKVDIKKVRRRIEDHLRKSKPEKIIWLADLLEVEIF